MKSIMTVEEIAKYLGFSTKKIYRLVENNKIPASKIGKQYRFMKEGVDRWLRENSIMSTPDWQQRLNTVLAKMRKTGRGTTLSDIDREIKKVRKEKRANP